MKAVLAFIFLAFSRGLRTKRSGQSKRIEAPAPGSKECHKQPNKPTECGRNERWSHEELRATLTEFKDIWARHPGGGKLGINHQFAEWFLVKTLKPSHIVESGLLHGQATWALREASGPDTPIFSLDPFDQTNKGFRDQNKNTKYITNNDWKDLTLMDWDALIPRKDRNNTLVILDDHQSFYDRFEGLKTLGFRHVFVEDNNAYGFGNTSPNFFCTKPELYKDVYKKFTPDVYYKSPWPTVNGKDQSLHEFDPTPQYGRKITWEDHAANAKWVYENMKTYFEFPAIFDFCEQRPSVLKVQELSNYGLPAKANSASYGHRYPPYIEIMQ